LCFRLPSFGLGICAIFLHCMTSALRHSREHPPIHRRR
jgi:hypothetical protein